MLPTVWQQFLHDISLEKEMHKFADFTLFGHWNLIFCWIVTYFQGIIPWYPTSCPVEWVDAENPLFLLHRSESTRKPKVHVCSTLFWLISLLSNICSPTGVLHTTGGYMVYTATTFKYAFDYNPANVYGYTWKLAIYFIFWAFCIKNQNSAINLTLLYFDYRCTGDCGWITRHIYVIKYK